MRLRGEPEGFWPRVKWWFRQEYRYWDRVEVIERELRVYGINGEKGTYIAKGIASALARRP